jgi:hypothetical protein
MRVHVDIWVMDELLSHRVVNQLHTLICQENNDTHKNTVTDIPASVKYPNSSLKHLYMRFAQNKMLQTWKGGVN